MALLEDYTKLLSPTNIPSSPGDSGAGLSPVPTSSYLPASSYATARPPGAVDVTPTLVSFNPKNLPSAYQGQNVPLDWQNIIASDPDYMQWSLGAGERADTAASQRKAAQRALAIRFGGLPSNFSDVYGDIDPTTLQTATANPESESNRLLRNYTQQVEQNRRQLAARGMLQSGELGYSQDLLDVARQGDIYDLNNEFLNAAQGNVNDYASIIAGLNSEQIDQIRASADRIAQMRLYQASLGGGYGGTDGGGTDGGGGTTTTPPPSDPWSYDALAAYAAANPGETSNVNDLYSRYLQNFYAGGGTGVGVGGTPQQDMAALSSLYSPETRQPLW